jgi:hypothetical protein
MILQDAASLPPVGFAGATEGKIFARLLRDAKLTLLPGRLLQWQSQHFQLPRIRT